MSNLAALTLVILVAGSLATGSLVPMGQVKRS